MEKKSYISILKHHTAKGFEEKDSKSFLRQVKRIFVKHGIEDELTTRYPGYDKTVWEELVETLGFSVNYGSSEHGTSIDIEFNRVIYFEQW